MGNEGWQMKGEVGVKVRGKGLCSGARDGEGEI